VSPNLGCIGGGHIGFGMEGSSWTASDVQMRSLTDSEVSAMRTAHTNDEATLVAAGVL